MSYNSFREENNSRSNNNKVSRAAPTAADYEYSRVTSRPASSNLSEFNVDAGQSRTSTMPTAPIAPPITPPTRSPASAMATSTQIAKDLVNLTLSGKNHPPPSSPPQQQPGTPKRSFQFPPRPNTVSKAYGASLITTATSAVSGSTPVTYLSEVEAAILRSNVPINLNETDEITVLGQRGIWANKAEVANWKGVVPISQYSINEDGSPQVITKRTEQRLTYVQVYDISGQMGNPNKNTGKPITKLKHVQKREKKREKKAQKVAFLTMNNI
jgi:hypothetical protein